MVLAMRTGITPSDWLAEDDRTLATALELLAKTDDEDDDKPAPIAQG